MKIKTFDVTGFGGGYEATTQKMIWNGVRHLLGQNNKSPNFKQYKGITGIAIADGEDAEALDKAIMEGVSDATGAMHQCAVNHSRYIAKNGYAKWCEELAESRLGEPEQFYEYEHEFDLTASERSEK